MIVDELGLCQGAVRVDVALVNEHLHGFEIKADTDSLDRLQHQAAMYSGALEMASIVAAERHLPRARTVLPAWWGIAVAAPTRGCVKIESFRRADANPAVDPAALVQLLWRDEVLRCLSQLGLAEGFRSKPRRALWGRLVEALSLDELSSVVKSTLKARGDWRSRGSVGSGGLTCQLMDDFSQVVREAGPTP